MKNIVYVVIPTFNAVHELPQAVDSVLAQSYRDFQLIIVDNGSTDGSREVIEAYIKKDKRVRAVWHDKNYGFTGGVNPGMRLAIEESIDYVALFNNDAIADRDWLIELVTFLEANPSFGIATCKLLRSDGKTYDSTGDIFTTWGLSYPRGRNEPAQDQYDHATTIFGASGGASMYRVSMLRKIGIFDDDFFAYYEDIDLSFRAQLSGWKVGYVPTSIVRHEQGVTSNRIKGFTTYQTMKNLPWVIWKNIPTRLLWRILPRFKLAYVLFYVSAIRRGQGSSATKGFVRMLWLLPRKMKERRAIQASRTVPIEYIWSILTHDLPPNAYKLRRLRSLWWRLRGRGDT